MTPEDSSPPEHSHGALNYRDPQADRSPISSDLPAAIGWGVLTAAIVAGEVLGCVLSNLDLSGQRKTIEWEIPCVGAVIGMTIILTLVRHYWRMGRKTVVAGIWIGFGIALLAEGLCFAGLRM